MEKPKDQVTIAAPISNREEYLPSYLNCILAQTYPKDLTSLYFLINNSTDQSKKILYNFRKEYIYLFKDITIDEYNNKDIPDSRNRQNRVLDYRVYDHLSYLRNTVCEKVNTDWLFSVDSDIMLTKKTLMELIKSKKKAIAALVCNGHEFALATPNVSPYKFTNVMFRNPEYKYIHFRRSQLKGQIEVDLTGAVFLIHKSLYKNAKYRYDPQGEDIPFCQDIQRSGAKIYCNCNLKQPHCMNLDLLERYKNGEFKF